MKSIFVSKLDESVTESTIMNHFSKYGFINKIELSKLPGGLCKGYAKISTNDPFAHKLILSSQHVLDGKRVKVEPFIQEDIDILSKDKDTVERRVCVYGVPKNYNSRKFREVFETNFGEVENAYVRKNSANKFNYGFVTFVKKETADHAISVKYVKLKKNKLEVRRFKPKGIKINKKAKTATNDEKICFDLKNFEIYGDRILQQIFTKIGGQDTPSGNSSWERKEKKASLTTIPRFMPEKYLKIYLKRILEKNPQIKFLTKEDIPALELFHHNTVDRSKLKKTVYNYDSIASRFSNRIEKNHYESNLVLNPIRRNRHRLESRNTHVGSPFGVDKRPQFEEGHWFRKRI